MENPIDCSIRIFIETFKQLKQEIIEEQKKELNQDQIKQMNYDLIVLGKTIEAYQVGKKDGWDAFSEKIAFITDRNFEKYAQNLMKKPLVEILYNIEI